MPSMKPCKLPPHTRWPSSCAEGAGKDQEGIVGKLGDKAKDLDTDRDTEDTRGDLGDKVRAEGVEDNPGNELDGANPPAEPADEVPKAQPGRMRSDEGGPATCRAQRGC